MDPSLPSRPNPGGSGGGGGGQRSRSIRRPAGDRFGSGAAAASRDRIGGGSFGGGNDAVGLGVRRSTDAFKRRSSGEFRSRSSGGDPKRRFSEEVTRNKEQRGWICHQCLHSSRNVVICSSCQTRSYCSNCLARWYPEQTKQDVQNVCPFCRGNCNCQACLHEYMISPINVQEADPRIKLQRLLYLINRILPLIRQIHKEQSMELEIEAKIRGIQLKEVDIRRTIVDTTERLYCDNCATSIFNFHRSCRNCSYDLCLTCCRELREGLCPSGTFAHQLFIEQNQDQNVSLNGQYSVNKHRFDWESQEAVTRGGNTVSSSSSALVLQVNGDGSIPCPSSDYGSCGSGLLELKRNFKAEWVAKLLKDAEDLANSYQFLDKNTLKSCSLCLRSVPPAEADRSDAKVRRAAFRGERHDNFLYCPHALDLGDHELNHFQKHWARGEPVIVRSVFDKTTGLSWEPNVMLKAIRETKVEKLKEESHTLKPIDCLSCCEVEISTFEFFKGYSEGRMYMNGWPELLKLKDWPSSSLLEEHLPRHSAEFVTALPYPTYTNPRFGLLNLATKIPDSHLKPDLGPKAYVAYGYRDELGRGDSVTKLHYDMTDAVNIMTHTAEVKRATWQQDLIRQMQKSHRDQDSQELYGNVNKALKKSTKDQTKLIRRHGKMENGLKEFHKRLGPCPPSVKEHNLTVEEPFKAVYGGAVWDIFRRQDVPKLIEYLQKHRKEFRHIKQAPVNSIIHPIHDQTFFLNERHKKQLKDEYNIEPWTFEQYCGEAVLIPAGCPHQVRNRQIYLHGVDDYLHKIVDGAPVLHKLQLDNSTDIWKSCFKVALDFVSPESVGECVRLTEECRFLPKTHRGKEDKLEVKKMSLYAMSTALQEARELTNSSASFQLNRQRARMLSSQSGKLGTNQVQLKQHERRLGVNQ